jgi:hypothetical protein
VIGAGSHHLEEFSSYDQEHVHHFAATCPREEIKVLNCLPRISLRFTVLAEVTDELMQSFERRSANRKEGRKEVPFFG